MKKCAFISVKAKKKPVKNVNYFIGFNFFSLFIINTIINVGGKHLFWHWVQSNISLLHLQKVTPLKNSYSWNHENNECHSWAVCVCVFGRMHLVSSEAQIILVTGFASCKRMWIHFWFVSLNSSFCLLMKWFHRATVWNLV